MLSFIWPLMLVFLGFIPLLALLYLRQLKRRQQFAASYGSLGLLRSAGGKTPGLRRHIPLLLFLSALSLLIVGLARPEAEVNLPRVEGTVILAFDVSGSMAATDLQPTRMEAAKAAARIFVERQPPAVQVGVVAFSDSGFSVQTPTNQDETIYTSINRLTPQRGTSLGQGILASLRAIFEESEQGLTLSEDPESTPVVTPTPVPEGTYTNAAIILLTDGENLEPPDPLQAAQEAANRGVRIYTVGIGSPEGTELEVNGFTVFTQLNEPLLQQIAALTDGAYYSAESEEELLQVYEDLNRQLVVKPEKIEITSLFAGASILILLAGGVISLLWFGRVP